MKLNVEGRVYFEIRFETGFSIMFRRQFCIIYTVEEKEQVRGGGMPQCHSCQLAPATNCLEKKF